MLSGPCQHAFGGYDFLGHPPLARRRRGFGQIGISYLELLVMFEQNFGHRLLCGKKKSHLAPSSGTSTSGCEIKRGCQFVHFLVRSLGHLLGGLAWFVPCQPGGHCTRWRQCGHGLTSRPGESSEQVIEVPKILCPSCPSTLQFRGVVGQAVEVLKVFTQHRVQQHLSNRSLTFLFLVEVLMIFTLFLGQHRYCRHKVTRVSKYDLPPLPPG